MALLSKFKSHSSGTRMSPPLLGTTDIDSAGPFQNWELAQKAQAGCLPPFRVGEQQKGSGKENRASPPAQRAELQRKSAPPLPAGASVTPASPRLPTPGRCPSQQLGDHTPRARRALAALLPGSYTLGTDLLPLPGEVAGGGQGEADKKGQTLSNAAGMDDRTGTPTLEHLSSPIHGSIYSKACTFQL